MAGAGEAGIRYITDHIGSNPAQERMGTGLLPAIAGNFSPGDLLRDPKRGCGSESPFTPGLGYRSARGYQYDVPRISESRSNKASLGGFLKETALGGLIGGLAGAAFYKVGKGIDKLKESVLPKKGNNNPTGGRKADFYVKPSGEAVPSTGYRYMPRDADYIPTLKETMKIPSRAEGTYITFDKFDVPAPGKLQTPHDVSIRGSFDTLQIIDDIRVPNGFWGQASWLEPLTNDYYIYGSGGATQAVTNHEIILDSLKDLSSKGGDLYF